MQQKAAFKFNVEKFVLKFANFPLNVCSTFYTRADVTVM